MHIQDSKLVENLQEGSSQWAYWNFLHNTTLYSPWTLHNHSSTYSSSDYEGRQTYWGPDRQELKLPLPAGWEPIHDSDKHTNFGISFQTILSTISWLLDELGQTNNEDGIGFVMSQSGIENPQNDTSLTEWTSAYMRPIDDYFENIAKSLSVWLRNVRQEHTAFANATETYETSFKRIRTPFFILPVGTILLGCTFAIWAIWDTHRLGLRAWKESSLPILVHGLTGSTRERLREADQANTAAREAKNTKVKLNRDSDGSFELREVDT